MPSIIDTFHVEMPSTAPFTKDNNILEILYDFNFGISYIIMYHSLSTSSNIA
jgi:hypothetical protein